jgi:hypothetical protein
VQGRNGNRKIVDSHTLTLFRRVLPPLPIWLDRPAAEERGPTPIVLVPTPIPMPTAGEMERAGMLGGGPGSAPGERRCIEREGPGAFIILDGPAASDTRRRAMRHQSRVVGFGLGSGIRIGAVLFVLHLSIRARLGCRWKCVGGGPVRGYVGGDSNDGMTGTTRHPTRWQMLNCISKRLCL